MENRLKQIGTLRLPCDKNRFIVRLPALFESRECLDGKLTLVVRLIVTARTVIPQKRSNVTVVVKFTPFAKRGEVQHKSDTE